MKDVYLVIDDYTPDAGSTIYGVYTTRELAYEAVEMLDDPEKSPYGEMDTSNIYVIQHSLHSKVVV